MTIRPVTNEIASFAAIRWFRASICVIENFLPTHRMPSVGANLVAKMGDQR